MADHWLSKAVQRWFALAAGVVSVIGIAGFVATARHYWAWLAIGALVLLVFSLGWTLRDEHKVRDAAEARASSRTHTPPGGGKPLRPPVEYQVTALRQVIARIAETDAGFNARTVSHVLRNLPRTGTDPVYEPLYVGSCGAGLKFLVEQGELVDIGGSWLITKG